MTLDTFSGLVRTDDVAMLIDSRRKAILASPSDTKLLYGPLTLPVTAATE
jgi:hypothetical protein